MSLTTFYKRRLRSKKVGRPGSMFQSFWTLDTHLRIICGQKLIFNLSTYRSTDITDNAIVLVFLDFVISEGDVYFFPALFFKIFNASLHF